MDDADFRRVTARDASARDLSAAERRNAEVVLSVYAAFAGQWNEDEQRFLYAPDFHDHSAMHGASFDDLVGFVRGFKSAFPEGSVTVERLFVDGEFVIAQVQGRLSPTHPPDAAVEIYRFSAGLIAEHWDVIRPHADFSPSGPGRNTEEEAPVGSQV